MTKPAEQLAWEKSRADIVGVCRVISRVADADSQLTDNERDAELMPAFNELAQLVAVERRAYAAWCKHPLWSGELPHE